MPRISRLEKHYDLIEKQIAAGKNYQQIALELSASGTQTSRVNISKWLRLRKKRIELRLTQIKPEIKTSVILPKPNSKPAKAAVPENLKVNKVEVAKHTNAKIVISNGLRKNNQKLNDSFFEKLIDKTNMENEENIFSQKRK